jgi:hypothetical protein
MTDKRVVRGEVRRAAWARVVTLLERQGDRVPREVPREYAGLFAATVLEIYEYAQRRAAGELGSPPGGVGTKR